MKSPINTVLAAILLLAISCKKENNTIRTSHIANNNSTQNSDPGVQAYVKIGTQIWMTTNLNIAHYRNGDVIPHVMDPAKWDTLTTGAWSYYNNDPANSAVYGKLYNWYAVHDRRGLAPIGWHIPSDSEWVVLGTRLGSNFLNMGGKMKDTGTIEAGTGLWHAPNTRATNNSGFTGLPGGYFSQYGDFLSIGYSAFFWSSTIDDTHKSYAWYRQLLNNYGELNASSMAKQNGLSVRCIKD